MDYNPRVGEGDERGRLSFRLFGTEYTLTTKEFGDFLGFQTGPTAITELPLSYYIDRDIDKFWQDLNQTTYASIPRATSGKCRLDRENGAASFGSREPPFWSYQPGW